MADQFRTDIPVPGNLTTTQAQAAVGKILCDDASNNRYKIGGDATAAAGDDQGAYYVYGLDQSQTMFTVIADGIVDDVTITGAIDFSADGPFLSFDASGNIVKAAAGENVIGRLTEAADVAGGGKARVRFTFSQT